MPTIPAASLGPAYALTLPLISAHAGALGIVCLDPRAEDRTFRLYREYPGAALNRRVALRADGAVEWTPARADLPSGAATEIREIEEESGTPLVRVDISGPIEQFAGYHDPCAGYADGHDAICARLCAAFEMGDVLLVVNSPGGAAAGLQQHVERAAACKARYGRHVTVYADEMIASAAMWWAAGIGDEIHGPAAAQIGSIGARGAHVSIAGALAQQGVVFNYFTWPDAGKVALAPEFPLSEEGRARGERDIAIMGEAFCAAMVASPIGQRYGLTREAVMALGADVFTGANALTCPDAGGAPRARLLDGIATLEEVTSYALALAEGGAGDGTMPNPLTMDMNESAAAAPPVAARVEEEPAPDSEPAPDGEEQAAAPEPEKPPADKMECAECHAAMPEHARYCSSCGVPVVPPGAPASEEAEEEEPPPPSSKPLPMPGHAAASAAIAPPRAMPASATLATILGADGTGDLAIKTAAIKARQVIDAAATVTGETGAGRIVGALLSLPGKLAAGQAAADALAAQKAAADDTKRRDLANRLNATGAVKRTDIFADDVSADGKRAGAPRIRSTYAKMDLDVLEGLVKGLEKNSAPSVKKTPFRPSEEEAQRASAAAVATQAAANGGKLPLLDEKGEPTAAAIAAAVNDPSVRKLFAHPDNTRTIEQIAAAFVKARAGGAA